jgi:hypothetical protein
MTDFDSREPTSIGEALQDAQQEERAEEVKQLRREFDTADKIAETLGSPEQGD